MRCRLLTATGWLLLLGGRRRDIGTGRTCVAVLLLIRYVQLVLLLLLRFGAFAFAPAVVLLLLLLFGLRWWRLRLPSGFG